MPKNATLERNNLADLRRDNPIIARSDPDWPDYGRNLYCPNCGLWIGDPSDPDKTVAEVSVDHDLGECERAIASAQLWHAKRSLGDPYVSPCPRDDMKRAIDLEFREYGCYERAFLTSGEPAAYFLRESISSLASGHIRLAGKWALGAWGGWLVAVGLAEDIFAPYYPIVRSKRD